MATKGGGRAQAGGKAAQATREVAAQVEKKIADRLPEIVDRMLELVEGVTVEKTDARGNTRVYTRPPDREAGKYLLDRLLGRPTVRQEVDGTLRHEGEVTVRDVLTEEEREAVRRALTGSRGS